MRLDEMGLEETGVERHQGIVFGGKEGGNCMVVSYLVDRVV